MAAKPKHLDSASAPVASKASSSGGNAKAHGDDEPPHVVSLRPRSRSRHRRGDEMAHVTLTRGQVQTVLNSLDQASAAIDRAAAIVEAWMR